MPQISDDLILARDGDEQAFARLVEPVRRELHAHCYRMLGSVHDADDALQETLVKAWRGLGGFAGRGSLRAWLYAVATRVCLDLSEARGRRALPADLGPASDHPVLDSPPRAEVAWLTPYAVAEQREAVELAFVAALQRLPGNQRAALLLFEVLGFSAAEIAGMMRTSVTSVNSALARARRVVARGGAPVNDPQARRLAGRFAATLAAGDLDGFVALLTRDVTWAMPPLAHWYAGVGAVTAFAQAVPMTLCPSWQWRLVTANGVPAVAFYLGETAGAVHEAWSITLLEPRGGRVAAITSFLDPGLFPLFGLPPISRPG
ncbi:ECF RNA polymerase sigma factor SigG [Paractinoplanes abujensis]|uniref:RNA polymerase sigma-70 factor (ECF subfamily) n=1 Tax=Paractinoplanes abujensis TaxID=882441 RepID=A0A7W7G4F5_9ACTN|nr:RNA polymerase subunit sigma-70 [Actinoplanes abujensis]MBB4693776.1 RNA polymerase sigma-70 factor (ECF subfamily) [Actinoplanes abujensis]GID21567.1 ECF RNA polymerase sigma factor SigG [Actinoplanes abujensis]